MKDIRNWIVSLAIIASVGGVLFTVLAPQTASADGGTNCSDHDSGFLGFPTWYRGLESGSGVDCKVTVPAGSNGLSIFIWTIALNIIDIVLMIVGYLSVGYIIYGGFLLMTGRGNPNDIADGQKTVRNAVIGLVISFGSVAIVNFISSNIITTDAKGLPATATDIVGNILGIVYMAGGITAVITIIVAGYMYTISGGNPAEVEKSKNTILYAVIGLIIIIGAFTITKFVIGSF